MNRRELLKRAGLVLGTAVSLPLSKAVLAGVQVAATPSSTGGLDAGSLGTVTAVSSRIIPATDTPGAIEAQVPAFVDLIYRDWYTATERAKFISAKSAFDTLCLEQYDQNFSVCSSQQQDDLLTLCESQSKDENSLQGFFFKSMKELTVLGYYTSEVGAKQELRYNPVPMRYKGDYLYSEVGTQWSY